jgi:rhamnogalacturonyl hydrolase YesR
MNWAARESIRRQCSARVYRLSWDQSSSTKRTVRTKDVLGIAPHFEKMLYDNAQLARVYLHAWQVTGKPFYRAIVEETLDYVVREMVDKDGPG